MSSIFKSNFVKLLISILVIVTTGTLIFISINNRDKKTDWKDKYVMYLKQKIFNNNNEAYVWLNNLSREDIPSLIVKTKNDIHVVQISNGYAIEPFAYNDASLCYIYSKERKDYNWYVRHKKDGYVTYTDISYMYNPSKPNYSFVDYNNFDNNYVLDKKEISYYKLEKSNFEEEFIRYADNYKPEKNVTNSIDTSKTTSTTTKNSTSKVKESTTKNNKLQVGSYSLQYGTYKGTDYYYTDDVNSKYEITIKIKSDNTYVISSSNPSAITNSKGKIEIINNTFGGSNSKAIKLGGKSFIVDSNNTITFPAGSGSSLYLEN